MKKPQASACSNRKPLVPNAGFLKTIFVMGICHASVALLCLNVMFDLFMYGIPLYALYWLGFIPLSLFHRLSTQVINFTTPIVYGIPMVFSGTKVFSNDIELLFEAKSRDSLLLANHGSRIDWMVGMFVGHLKEMGKCTAKMCRVGFVCEALIQLMPLIGWYRKIVCDDIFVWRSFDHDAPTINRNISRFHRVSEQRMLFLSPEGVVVDHSDKDMEYIRSCKDFAKANGFKPFEFVLTPRYKGTSCLLEQVSKGGPLVSVCLVFVRGGKLLNCRLESPHREVPDIYHLNQGIAGDAISIFIHLRRIKVPSGSVCDMKAILMNEYKWKDSILAEWDSRLSNGSCDNDAWKTKYEELKGSKRDIIFNHLAHGVIMMILACALGCQKYVIATFSVFFCIIASSHTLGYLVSETSMESVPFETGIKAAIALIAKQKEGISKKKN